MRRAFVSHSTADDSYVAEMESFLRAAGCDDVFNDASAIKPDEQFWPAIEKGITACDTFVVVITAAATNSEWVRREVALARRLGKRVIPIWREDCPLPRDFADRDVIDFRPRARAERRFDISRITKYAPADLIGRADETKLLADAWQKTLRLEPGRPHVLTFVALGGEGKTSLVAKWAATLAGDNWPGCDAAFAWSFYSQGTREQLAASSDLFLKEALNFFATGTKEEVAEIKAFAASAAGAFEKGQRLARLVGQRRSLLILDGLEPLQYAPTAPAPGELKDQGVAALLKGLAAASHGLCVVTTRYSLPDLRAFWQSTAKEARLLRLSREAGVHLLKSLGVQGSELRNLPLDSTSQTEAPKGAIYDSPGQRPGLAAENGPSALKGRDKTIPCDAPTGHADLGDAGTQGVALGCPIAGRWPARSDDGRELVNEYEKLVEDVKGHALTLALLGGFLKRAFHGDIRQRDRVKFEKADEKMDGGHAFRTMAAYEQWLLRDGGDEGRREVAVLRLMGLFDRPADAGCLAALRRETIPGLTEPLAGLADHDWEYCLSGLEDAKLLTVNRDASGALLSLDAHPHLREYFARQLRTQHPDAWRAAHRRLYEHLCTSTKEGEQPTLEDLQPLYQAVAHGCQAGLQQETRDKVFRARLDRGNEFYSTKKLGAFGSDLGAIACFFEQPWSRISPALSESAKAFTLNAAAFTLRALGRLSESLAPIRAALAIAAKQNEWKSAAARASNLSELELTLGEVAGAVGDAEQSVTYADRSGDASERMIDLTIRADAWHHAGRRAEAETRFREAEQMQAESQPDYPLLYSQGGFLYCDLLLAAPERAAWQIFCSGGLRPPNADQPNGGRRPPLQDIDQCRAVSQRAGQTLKWAEQARQDILSPSLDHLTLGRAALYAAILEDSDLRLLTSDLSHIDAAVDGLRRSGNMDDLPRGLLTRAWLRFLTGARTGPESAQEDLDEAWEIAERGPMKLFLADIHLHRARLFGKQKAESREQKGETAYPWESPQADLAAAEKLIHACGYHRRDDELATAKRCLLSQPS